MFRVPLAEHKQGVKRPLPDDERKEDERLAKRPRLNDNDDDDEDKILKHLKAFLASHTLRQAHTKLKTLQLSDNTLQINERRSDGSLLVDVQRKNGMDQLLVSSSRLLNQELAIRSQHQKDIDIECRLRFSSTELTVNTDSKDPNDRKLRVAIPREERDLLLNLSDGVQPSNTPVHVPFPHNPLQNLEAQHASGTLPFKYEPYESRWVSTTDEKQQKRIELFFANHRKTIFIKSPCGTGKSRTSVEIIEGAMTLPCPDGKTGALSIVSRQSLSRTQATMFLQRENESKTPLHVVGYLDAMRDELRNHENLIISADSTIHLDDGTGELRVPRVLWLDEVVPFIRYCLKLGFSFLPDLLPFRSALSGTWQRRARSKANGSSCGKQSST
jgi:hypothetical protein